MIDFRRDDKPAGPLSPTGLGVIVGVAAIDQASKLAADALLHPGGQIPLLPILSLLRVDNTGIAWSFLAGSGTMLILLMVAVTLIVLAMWARSDDGGWPATIGFALIVGGAVGNLVDRIRLGHVIDFLFLHLGERPLFVFNVADIALTAGPAILLLIYIWPRRPAS